LTFENSNDHTYPYFPLRYFDLDPEARLAHKGPGKEAKLSYAGQVLMENRNGSAVNGEVTQAEGRAEPQAAIAMVEQIPGWQRVTLEPTKGYGRRVLCRSCVITRSLPHIAVHQHYRWPHHSASGLCD
jgi:hypothetical protein